MYRLVHSEEVPSLHYVWELQLFEDWDCRHWICGCSPRRLKVQRWVRSGSSRCKAEDRDCRNANVCVRWHVPVKVECHGLWITWWSDSMKGQMRERLWTQEDMADTYWMTLESWLHVEGTGAQIFPHHIQNFNTNIVRHLAGGCPKVLGTMPKWPSAPFHLRIVDKQRRRSVANAKVRDMTIIYV